MELKLSDLDNRCPVRIVSTGHSKVMIGINSRTKLNSLSPDLAKLNEISKTIKCSGYFVFTFDSDNTDILTHGRMFAPAIGIPEDPVTGNANGPLGAYIVYHGLAKHDNHLFQFKSQQGEAMGRPGTVNVTVEIKEGKPVKVKVGGQAVIVFKTEIKL